jgi:integrase
MKVKGNGQGKVLTQEELRRLFSEGFSSPRDRALFGICLFTGCRISEALALQTTDIKGGMLTFRKSITKGKLKTRVVDIQPGLAPLLQAYQLSIFVLYKQDCPQEKPLLSSWWQWLVLATSKDVANVGKGQAID